MNSDENVSPRVDKQHLEESKVETEPTPVVESNDKPVVDASATETAEKTTKTPQGDDEAKDLDEKAEVSSKKSKNSERNLILIFNDEQKLSQKIGFAINRVKAGELIKVEAYGNSISRGITLASIVRERLSSDEYKVDVYMQTSFVSRSNEKTGRPYSGLQILLCSDSTKLDSDSIGFQKPGDQLSPLRTNLSQQRSGRYRRVDRRGQRSNSRPKKPLGADSDAKREKPAESQHAKSSSQPRNQSRRRSNSKKKQSENSQVSAAPPAADNSKQSLDDRRQARRGRRNQSQNRSEASTNLQSINNKSDPKANQNNNQRPRNRSRSQRNQQQSEQHDKKQSVERPANFSSYQQQNRNGYRRPDQNFSAPGPAPQSARSNRSQNYQGNMSNGGGQYQDRRPVRPENLRPDRPRYPYGARQVNNGYPRPMPRGNRYGQMPAPPRFTQQHSMNQSIFSGGSYQQQHNRQNGHVPGYFPANKDPKMVLNAPISDYRQQSSQHQAQYSTSIGMYGSRPIAQRYRDAEQRMPITTGIRQ